MSLARPKPSAERLYMAALSLSGLAALVSVALPAPQRGVLVACVVAATLGAALGSFSVDTFLLSRPAGWVVHRGRWWVLALLGGCVVLSAVVVAGVVKLVLVAPEIFVNVAPPFALDCH